MGLNAVTFAVSAMLIATVAARGGASADEQERTPVRRRPRGRPRPRLPPGDPHPADRPPPASCCASASPTSAKSSSRARSCTSAAPAWPCWSPPAASARSSARSAPASPPPARGSGAAPTCSASRPWPSSSSRCASLDSFWLVVPVLAIGGFGNGLALVHDRLLLAAQHPAGPARPPLRAAEDLHLVRLRDLVPRERGPDRGRRRPDRLPRLGHRPGLRAGLRRSRACGPPGPRRPSGCPQGTR